MALAWLIGAMGRMPLSQLIGKVVPAKAFLDNIVRLVQLGLGRSVTLPHRDISLGLFHPRTG